MRVVKIWSAAVLAVALMAAAAFGQVDSTGGNRIWVDDATGAVGGTSTVHIKADSDTDIHAIQFDVLFDQTTLQIKTMSNNGVALGSAASELSLPVIDEDAITSANSSGKLTVYMLDLNSDASVPLGKVSAGTNLDLLAIKFGVDSGASTGDQTISLANVSLVNVSQDTVTTEIEFTAESGTLTIGAFAQGDASGDGKIDIFDLLAILKALRGTPTVGPSDVNGDGKTNIFDVLAFLQILKNK